MESGPNPQKIGPSPEGHSFQSCLVEGSPEQRSRERSIRRRALIISIVTQGAILAAIVLFPLFGKPERIAFAMTPIPPYYHSDSPAHPNTPARPDIRHKQNISDSVFSQPTKIPQHIDDNPEPESPEPPGPPSGSGPSTPCAACIPIADARPQPSRPAEVQPQTPHRLVVAHLESAMLIQRVEPVYPPLARQIHREGRVELRAIISTDGSIQSLQVVTGDPLFLQSALDAVSRWRYRATVLNGQPVEIDTYITVIYSLQH